MSWKDEKTFFEDPEEEREARRRPVDNRCTPDKLLEFIRKTIKTTGKFPTLRDCKHQFGGIIGPMLDLWSLQKQGINV